MKYSILTIFIFLCVVGFSSHSIYADEIVTEENSDSPTTEVVTENEDSINEDLNMEILDQEIISNNHENDVSRQLNSITQKQETEPVLEVNIMSDGWNENNTVYYQNGEALNGMQKIDDSYYLFNNQKLNKSFTGFAQSKLDNKWYFLRNGKSDWSFTGVAQSIENGKWYHANNGILDWNFTGFSKSVDNGRWYFSRKGALDWSFTGVAKSIANGKWYHAKKGALDWNFTGFSKSVENNRWYFSRKGALDWFFTGVAKSITNGKWYHAKKGALDWGFTGVSKSVENGKWYFSRKGALDWSFTGIGQSVENSKFYYVNRGCLNWKYNGQSKDVDGNIYKVKSGRATLIARKGHVYMTGIDISQWNGLIDLTKYIGQFVIIRATYGTTLDPLATRHMNECERLGIPYGVYCYSYALNNEEAKQEANFLLNVIKGRNISLGVWFDMEDADGYKNKNNKLDGNLMSQFCNTFCNTVYSKGYYTGIYSSASWFTSYLSTTKKYPWWVAHWGVNDGKHNINTSNMGPMQQFTSVPLDRNVIYQPLSMFKR